jgi:hypothetical protein
MSRMPVTLLSEPVWVQTEQSFVDEVLRCMGALQRLVAIQTELLSSPELTTRSVMYLTQLSSSIEHRLLRCRLPPHLQTGTTFMLHEACRLAQLESIYCIFHSFGPSCVLYRSLSRRLTKTLVSLMPFTQHVRPGSETRLLIWIVCVGAMASLDRDWYADRLVYLMSELGIAGNNELQGLLEEYVWSPRMIYPYKTVCNHVCQFWHE